MSVIIVLFSLMSCLASLGQAADNIFCYYSSFAYKRHGLGNFLPENVNPHLCTHLVYAFVDITPDGRDLQPINKNDQGSDGLYARTMALKEKNPALKILLAVGGWRVGSKPFIPMIESEDNQREWIKNVISYLRRYNFDGFDIDWEFPATRGSPPEDKYRFTLLMKGLYEAFEDESAKTGNTKLLLTLATASGTYYIDRSYEPDKIFHYIDFMLLMTYNYHGQWEKVTGHHSGLYRHRDDPTTGEKAQLYQQWSIDYWLDVGVPKEKLIVGLPTYGMSFTLADSSDNGVRAPAIGGGRMGDYTTETGILAYYEICTNLQNKGWNSVWIDDQAAPYAYSGNQWVGYEDQKSIALKARNIKTRGLAGAFVWSVEMDDFKGTCGQGKYPLLTTIQEIIEGSSRIASTERQPDIDHKTTPEMSHKTKKQIQVIAPSNAPKVISEKPSTQSMKGLRRKYAKTKLINAAAASVSKPEMEMKASKQTRKEVAQVEIKAEHRGTWWLGKVRKRKAKNWWTQDSNEDLRVKRGKTRDLQIKKDNTENIQEKKDTEKLQVKKDNTEDLPVKKDNTEDLPVKKDNTENLQVKKDNTDDLQVKIEKIEDSQVKNGKPENLQVEEEKTQNLPVKEDKVEDLQVKQDTPDDLQVKNENNEDSNLKKDNAVASLDRKTKSDDFHASKSKNAFYEVPKTTSEWYIPADPAEEEIKEVEVVETADICRNHGTGTFANPGSCEQFIVCMPGDWRQPSHYVMTCPVGTRFDSSLKICNYASSVPCHL